LILGSWPAKYYPPGRLTTWPAREWRQTPSPSLSICGREGASERECVCCCGRLPPFSGRKSESVCAVVAASLHFRERASERASERARETVCAVVTSTHTVCALVLCVLLCSQQHTECVLLCCCESVCWCGAAPLSIFGRERERASERERECVCCCGRTAPMVSMGDQDVCAVTTAHTHTHTRISRGVPRDPSAVELMHRRQCCGAYT
jgi:hypothetical protein